MTDTPGTPLTPAVQRDHEEAWAWANGDDLATPISRDHASTGECLACARLARFEAASRERRERVDPDLLHPDDGHEHSWGCRRCGVDPSLRQFASDVFSRAAILARQPDEHGKPETHRSDYGYGLHDGSKDDCSRCKPAATGEEREAQIEALREAWMRVSWDGKDGQDFMVALYDAGLRATPRPR